MKHYVDARGKQCPIPVVETRKVIDVMGKEDVVETLVDNEIAVQNLLKMAKQRKLSAKEEPYGEKEFRVLFSFGETAEETPAQPVQEEQPKKPEKRYEETLLVAVSSDRMGEGDDTLGNILMKGFLYALTGLEKLPDTILFYNGGARLSVEGSPALEDLKKMEEEGVEILTCGTCLNHYGLTEKLAVGKITDMYTICEKMASADKVVKP